MHPPKNHIHLAQQREQQEPAPTVHEHLPSTRGSATQEMDSGLTTSWCQGCCFQGLRRAITIMYRVNQRPVTIQ